MKIALSKIQEAAAQRLGQDVCVIAGPGSGKTRVLIERFRWLVEQKGVPLRRILAITFTEKAATEIQQRLIKVFENNATLRAEIEHAWVSTIDGFCARLLRENAIAAGVDPQFQVADEGTAESLRLECAHAVLEALYQEQPEQVGKFLRSLAVSTFGDGKLPDIARSLVEIYEQVRVTGASFDDASLLRSADPDASLQNFRQLCRRILDNVPAKATDRQRGYHDQVETAAAEFLALACPLTETHLSLVTRMHVGSSPLKKDSAAWASQDDIKKFRAELLTALRTPQRQLITAALRVLDQTYRQRKRARSLLDFADIEEDTIRLLREQPELREKVQNSFEFILMDELQDTNPLQWELLSLIRRPSNFFAVGDVNQSIFGFRHAEPGLFHGYRQALLEHGKHVDELRRNYRSRGEILEAVNEVFEGVKGIDPHTLVTEDEEASPAVEVTTVWQPEEWQAEALEVRWIAARIQKLIAEGHKYSEIAILTRTNGAMVPLQHALDDAGVPSIVLGGRSFFGTREVMDLMQALRAIDDPKDEYALAGLLRSPLIGMGDEEMLRLRLHAHSLWQAIAGTEAGVLLRELRALRETVSPDRLLRRLLDRSGYEEGIPVRARSNIEKLLAIIRNQWAASPSSIAGILAYLSNFSPEAEAPPNDIGNAVRLLTIHKSKGLEFPVVFLPSLHRSMKESVPTIAFDRRFGIGVRWRLPEADRGCSDVAHVQITDARTARCEEEENRLLYVAMTRAERRMFLSFSRKQGSKIQQRWDSIVPKLRMKGLLDQRVESEADLPQFDKASVAGVAENGVLELEPLTGPDQYDATASVTSISLFHTCPRKYYLARYLGWNGERQKVQFDFDADPPPADSGELDASELGTQVHQILAGVPVETPVDRAVELAGRFTASLLGQQAARAKRSGKEFDVLLELEDVVLRGQIDLWFEQGGGITIVDYKTDSIESPVDPGRIESYSMQLQIYAIALEKLLQKPVTRAVLHFLHPNEVVEVDVSPLQRYAAQQAVAEFRAAHAAMQFPVKPGNQCYRCEFFRNACPAEVGAFQVS